MAFCFYFDCCVSLLIEGSTVYKFLFFPMACSVGLHYWPHTGQKSPFKAKVGFQ